MMLTTVRAIKVLLATNKTKSKSSARKISWLSAT